MGNSLSVHYDGLGCNADFTIDPAGETVWATQKEIAEAFGINRVGVTQHLQAIFAEGELDRGSTSKQSLQVRLEGGRRVSREIEHYNLDAILAVGYRVSSKKATEFRKWATRTLRDYIVQGYAINEQRLRNDPEALRRLAARVATLRDDEKNLYRTVRDVFAFSTTDYDKSSAIAKTFYARWQNRLLYASSGKTAAELIMERADHRKPTMGLTGSIPQRSDTIVGKNYLDEDELRTLYNLSKVFLLFIESKAIRGQAMTMAELADKFEELLRVQGHVAFPGYGRCQPEKAHDHALREFERWRELARLVSPATLDHSRSQRRSSTHGNGSPGA